MSEPDVKKIVAVLREWANSPPGGSIAVAGVAEHAANALERLNNPPAQVAPASDDVVRIGGVPYPGKLKLVYVKRWRTLVALPETYAEEIVAALAAPPAPASEPDWRDDPAADDRWQAGCDYAMMRLCDILGVDMKSVRWDAATETLDGDVCAVLWNILVAKYGDGFDPSHAQSGQICADKPWHDGAEIPPVKQRSEREYIVAVRRAISEKVYTFSCSYLNALPLNCDDCPHGQEANGCGECTDDGCPFTGWYYLTGEDGDSGSYQSLNLGPGDKLMGWREMPQWEESHQHIPGGMVDAREECANLQFMKSALEEKVALLDAQVECAKATLKAYEQWEADIILENKCWTGQNIQLTDAIYERMIEIQDMRNKFFSVSSTDGAQVQTYSGWTYGGDSLRDPSERKNK